MTVGDPFYYEWKPVRFASMYSLEIAINPNFSPIAETCYTSNTTYTPASSESNSCMPQAEGTYWWRVTAIDQFAGSGLNDEFPRTSQNVFNDARFTYSPARVSLAAPLPAPPSRHRR